MNEKFNKICSFCYIDGERWNFEPCSLMFERNGIEISLRHLKNPTCFYEFKQNGENHFSSVPGWNSSELGFRDKLENRENSFASNNQRRQVINSILELDM